MTYFKPRRKWHWQSLYLVNSQITIQGMFLECTVKYNEMSFHHLTTFFMSTWCHGGLLAQNMCTISSLKLSKKPLARETDTIKSRALLQNFNSWMIRFTKKPFRTWQFGKIGGLVNFSIPNCKFFKTAPFFIVSVSLVRVCFLWKNRENSL